MFEHLDLQNLLGLEVYPDLDSHSVFISVGPETLMLDPFRSFYDVD